MLQMSLFGEVTWKESIQLNQVINGSILKEQEILPNLGVDFGNFMRQRRCGSSCSWRGMALSLRCRSCTGDVLHSQQLAQGVVKRKKRFFIFLIDLERPWHVIYKVFLAHEFFNWQQQMMEDQEAPRFVAGLCGGHGTCVQCQMYWG